MTMTDGLRTTQTCAIRAMDGTTREFEGYLLGSGTSRLDTHIHPPGAIPEGLRCSGCRWNEVRIWRSVSDNCYVVGVKGHTSVSGEEHRYKSWWATSADGVLDLLLVKPPARRAFGKPEGYRELPEASYDAIDEASERDPEISRVLLDFEDSRA